MNDTQNILAFAGPAGSAFHVESPNAPGSANSEWPARDIVQKLIEAADLLLVHCNYDGHGWEEIHLARSLAHSWAESPNASAPLAARPGSVIPEWAAAEIRETWNAARDSGGEMQAFRIIERMVDRLGYGRTQGNPPLLPNAPASATTQENKQCSP